MKLFILDTDTLSLQHRGHSFVCENVGLHDAEDLAISVITVEEQLSGWYTMLRKAKSVSNLARAYARLAECVESVSDLRVLTFDEACIQRFNMLHRLRTGVRGPDLKIAATVLQFDGTLVTRNTRDFAKIPGLRFVDWSVAANE